jgi:7-cyano-7-deazaguanine tRNA-ribosyltransferase
MAIISGPMALLLCHQFWDNPKPRYFTSLLSGGRNNFCGFMGTVGYETGMKKMLEIVKHDGPARLGKWNDKLTPSMVTANELIVVEDQAMPYDVPRELAEWSVEQTILKAHEGSRKEIAVIHGAKYPDLRLKCVHVLEDMGYRNFLIANTDKLLQRPRELVKTMVKLREIMNPNSSLYVPFCETNFIPLLAYLGVDLFGDVSCGYYAQLGVLLTPDGKYPLNEYKIYEMDLHQILMYNQNSMDFVLCEVREHIRNGTLRNLVEMRCCSSPGIMSALRILDRDYGEFLDIYTPIY